MKEIIVVGSNAKLVLQTMLAVYSRWKIPCIVIGDETCRPLARSALCKRHIEMKLHGEENEQLIQAVNSLAADMKDPVIVPADCEAACSVSRSRSRLQVPSIPLMPAAQIELFNDKWRFYQFCREHGFNTPDTVYLGDKQAIDFDRIVTQIGLPFVIKPTNQAGSTGVHIVYSRDYFDKEVATNPDYMYGPLLAQQFIAGDDGGMSVLSVHGKVRAFAIQKYVRNGVDFVPNAFLEQEVHRFCEAGRYHGLGNVDVRMEAGTGKVYFTETNPRVWASTFASVWCGLNFVAESIESLESSSQAPVRKLTEGHFHDRRHPLVWPPSWPYLLLDRGARGRLARAMTFDRYMLPLFLSSLPSRTSNFVKRRLLSKGPVTRPHA